MGFEVARGVGGESEGAGASEEESGERVEWEHVDKRPF
jgi:hypothetical protein